MKCKQTKKVNKLALPKTETYRAKQTGTASLENEITSPFGMTMIILKRKKIYQKYVNFLLKN